MIRKNLSLMCLLITFSLMGCAAPQAKMRYVWPPLPDEPKIEYLGVYNNVNDIADDSLASKFLGRDVKLLLQNPQMAAGDGKGRVFVTDIKLGGVLVFDFNSKDVTLLGGEGGMGLFGQPTGIAIDGEGFIYVADSKKMKILVFTREGNPYGNIDFSTQLKSIGFIAIDKQRKRIIVPDPKDHKVYIAGYDGKIVSTLTKSDKPEMVFNRPNAAAVAPNGDILVADSFNARVAVFNAEGAYLSEFGARGDNPGQFNIIQGIAVDSVGHVYITDARANRLSIMNTKGELLLSIGSSGDSLRNIGVFQIPFGISIDQNDTIYIVEKFVNRFQKYQYLSPDYLLKNPIKTEILAKPLEEKKD